MSIKNQQEMSFDTCKKGIAMINPLWIRKQKKWKIYVVIIDKIDVAHGLARDILNLVWLSKLGQKTSKYETISSNKLEQTHPFGIHIKRFLCDSKK
jgi:hypothetical protein